MMTTQLTFKAAGTKPVDRIPHVKPVIKHPKMKKCEGCHYEYPAYDMEGGFCSECYVELQGQRQHEQEARSIIQEF